MTDWFLSHTTHSSSFNPQLVLSLDHPPASESWSESQASALLRADHAEPLMSVTGSDDVTVPGPATGTPGQLEDRPGVLQRSA